MKTKKKPGRKPLKQVRAQRRRGNTIGKTTEMVQNLGQNPFHLANENKKATRALATVIQKFQREYFTVVDKYSSDISSEPLTRQSVISALQLEMSKSFGK